MSRWLPCSPRSLSYCTSFEWRCEHSQSNPMPPSAADPDSFNGGAAQAATSMLQCTFLPQGRSGPALGLQGDSARDASWLTGWAVWRIGRHGVRFSMVWASLGQSSADVNSTSLQVVGHWRANVTVKVLLKASHMTRTRPPATEVMGGGRQHSRFRAAPSRLHRPHVLVACLKHTGWCCPRARSGSVSHTYRVVLSARTICCTPPVALKLSTVKYSRSWFRGEPGCVDDTH
jgi:hypothetical protein